MPVRPSPVSLKVAASSAFAASSTAVRNLAGFHAHALAPNDDGSTNPIALGFTAAFFGANTSTVYVNNNGNVTFNDSLSQFTPNGLASGVGQPIIAAYFADVDTRGAGSGLVTYGTSLITDAAEGWVNRPAFGVEWPAVGYYDTNTDKLNTFELILVERSDTGPGNFDIEFNYNSMQWETGDASGATGGLGGVSAVVGYSNGLSGASNVFFQLPGSLVNGALINGGSNGLISHSWISTVPGRYYFQVRNGGILVANPAKSQGDSADRPGGCACGEPVDVGTGNLFEEVDDYTTVGLNKLTYKRFYNAQANSDTFANTLGRRWRSNYDRYIRIVSPTSVTVERANGQQVNFNLISGTWTPDSDVDLRLTPSGSTWILTDNTDGAETYTTSASTQAVLTSIQARNGYTLTLQRNASNQLTSASDSYGRTLSFTYSGALLHTVTTPDGLVLTYSYTSSGVTAGVLDRLASVSYSTTPPTSQAYVYENSSQPFALTGIIDENGNRYTTWTYDSLGRVLMSQHAGGADLTTFTYDDATGNRTVTNALGAQLVYKFTTLQGVPKVTEIDRLATSTTTAATRTFTYDNNGFAASQTDWNGGLTTYLNDIHGQPTSITEASGTAQARTRSIAYHATLHLPTSITTPGLTTTFTYDSSGEVLTKTLTDTTVTTVPYSTNGQSRTWSFTWANHLLASVKGPRTDVNALTQFTYDSSGALTKATNAVNQVTQITQHMPGGLPQTIVDPNGVTTTLTYDARQRLLTSTLSTGGGSLVTKYAYDAAGNIITTTLPDGSALTNAYDSAHRPTSTTDLFSQKIVYTLDALGNRTQTNILDASSAVKRQRANGFDALSRLLKDTGGAGQITGYAYDANGNPLSITDSRSNITKLAFDSLNRTIKITDPASGVISTTYDAHDRPLSVTDPNGKATTYIYDGFGDVIQQVSPATGTTTYRYDADGNVVQKTDAAAKVTNYTYDALNRLLTTKYPAAALENITLVYDQTGHGFGIGRLTGVTDAVGSLSRSYDERGNVLSEIRVYSGVTLAMSYTYDAASRMVALAYPSGWAVSYNRDSMGRVTAMTAKKGSGPAQSVLSNVTYQPFGPVSTLTFGNNVAETRGFDLDYRLTNLTDMGTSVIQKLTYGYDAADNIVSIVDGVTSGKSQTFSYDTLYRLTSATGAYGNLGYSYDANGNRLTETSPASTVQDGLGLVTTLTYNQSGRLSAVSAGSQSLTQYSYDAFGQRLTKVGSMTGSTLFQYDLSGHLLEETNGQGNAQADYIYLGDRPVASLSPSTGKLYFLHDDRLGTPQLATDSSQTVQWMANYQPFGSMTNSSNLIVQDLRLPGQEWDVETGLHHNGFRDYAPMLGRYIQSDPIGIAGGVNTYGYVAANPIKYRDFRGLDIWIEGPNPNEPNLHQSVNVGDPNGYYESYSFGANGYWLQGEVYRDTEHGGQIEAFKKTTPEEDATFRSQLEGELGNTGIYGWDDICRSYSQRKFGEAPGVISTPPARITGATGGWSWRSTTNGIGSPTGTTTRATSTSGTSTSQ